MNQAHRPDSDLISALAGGEIEAGEAAAVRAALDADDDLRDDYEALLATTDLLAGAPAIRAPRNYAAALHRSKSEAGGLATRPPCWPPPPLPSSRSPSLIYRARGSGRRTAPGPNPALPSPPPPQPSPPLPSPEPGRLKPKPSSHRKSKRPPRLWLLQPGTVQ